MRDPFPSLHRLYPHYLQHSEIAHQTNTTMQALSAQAMAFQPSPAAADDQPVASPVNATFAGPWATGLQLYLAPLHVPLDIGFVAGVSAFGHSAAAALFRFGLATGFYSSALDWDPVEDPVYDELAVGDERHFPHHPRAQKMLAEVGKPVDTPPPSPDSYDGFRLSTPSLGSSGPPTPERETVGTPPVESEDEEDDILWYSTPSTLSEYPFLFWTRLELTGSPREEKCSQTTCGKIG